LASLLSVATAGCGAEVMAYAPQPAKVADPQKELEDVTNLAEAPPLKVEVTDTYLKLVYDNGQYGLSTTLLRFSSISDLKLLKGKGLYKGLYRVEVHDAAGELKFGFGTKDVATAQRLIDALAAARQRVAKAP
jgi:hypothetical protein